MKIIAFRFSLLTGLFFAFTSIGAYAQGPGSGGPIPGPTPTDPTAVPIDGGVSVLLAAGGALALRKLRNSTRRSR